MSDKKSYCQRYRSAWENDQRFRGWLQPFPGDGTKARCKVCGSAMRAHMRSINGHCMGKRHIENMKSIGSKDQDIFNEFLDFPEGQVVKSQGTEQKHLTGSEDLSSCQPSSSDKPHDGSLTPKFKFIPKPPLKIKKGTTHESLSTVMKTLKATAEKYDQKPENEFGIFGKYIACQLEQLPLENAVTLQIEIQNMIGQERLRLLRQENLNSSPDPHISDSEV